MLKGDRLLIEPMTDEQRRKETALSLKLSEAESATVSDILSQAFTPDSLQKVIVNASGFAEAMSQKFRDPATPEVPCQKGCNWCCFQLVSVSAPEVFRIIRFLSSEVMATRQTDIINRLRKLDKTARGKSPKARSKLHLPCAFLADGQCTIYSVRPLACAEFTSFNLQDCKRGYRIGFKPDSIIHEKARMLVYYAVQQGLSDGLRLALPTADTTPLELTSAVVSALDFLEPEASWIAGGKVFAYAHFAISRA
jgi:Fe-S-cluster containining protein